MNERDKTLNRGTLHQRDRKGLAREGRGNPKMGCLAELACPVVLAIWVDVAGGEDNKEDGEDAQSEGQQPSRVPSVTISDVPVRHSHPPQ